MHERLDADVPELVLALAFGDDRDLAGAAVADEAERHVAVRPSSTIAIAELVPRVDRLPVHRDDAIAGLEAGLLRRPNPARTRR